MAMQRVPRVTKRILLLAVLPGLFINGCSRQQPSNQTSTQPAPWAEGTIALVNGQPIAKEVWRQQAARRAADGGKAALEELIRQELLFQHACAAGYDRDPQLLASFRRMVAAKFEEERLASRSALAPSPGEARTYYEANLDKYRLPEKRRAAVLFMHVPQTASAEKKTEFAARAQAIRQEALTRSESGGYFGALVAKHSDDQATRYSGGDLGWLARGEVAPRFGLLLTDGLFALNEIGDLSPLIETPDGFCFIKLIDHRAASVRPFEEVREAIVYQMTQQRRQQARRDFDQQLRAGAEIQIDEDAVAAAAASVAAKTNEPKPPRMPSL